MTSEPVETAKIVMKLVPFDDGNGHRYTVSAVRTKKPDGEASVDIYIEQGGSTIAINVDDWRRVRVAADRASDHISECEE